MILIKTNKECLTSLYPDFKFSSNNFPLTKIKSLEANHLDDLGYVYIGNSEYLVIVQSPDHLEDKKLFNEAMFADDSDYKPEHEINESLFSKILRIENAEDIKSLLLD